mgnify:CR=1 FL=1
MKKQFRLRAFDSKKYFMVMVYDKVKDLRLEATKYDGRADIKEASNDNVLGLCHPFEKFKVLANGETIKSNQIGILRFSKKHLRTHIVFHEIMHAAFWQYRLSLPKKAEEKADFGAMCSPKEEAFIHLAGKVYTDMIRKMYKHKYWK